MRQALRDLIEKTLVFEYELTHLGKNIEKTIFSTLEDNCYSCTDINELIVIIYNSIVEYSYNEFDLSGKDFESLHTVALKTKLRYNEDADLGTKIKYGFFGEVLLYALLYVRYHAKPLISRGYFYNPLENSETKGYDSYQLVDNTGQIELWFGEVKFHINYSSAIKSALSNIEKALSDGYFEQNIFSISNHKNNFNCKGSEIEKIIEAWEANPSIKIIDEIRKYKMKLVYPVFLIYESDSNDYDSNIKKAVEYIKKEYQPKKFSITIDYSVFFILMPLKEVKKIKAEVISWIETKAPLIL